MRRTRVDRPGADDETWVDATEASRLLDVQRQTLYAYVSRGLVRSAPTTGSRAHRYHRADVERLQARRRARSGHGATAAGALRWGEPVLDSALTAVTESGHAYRGRSAVELAQEGVGFERTAELLWTGELPSGSVRWGVQELGAAVSRLEDLLPQDARPVDALAVTVPALAVSDPDRHAFTPARAGGIVRRLAGALACNRGLDAVDEALAADTVARSVLLALGGKPKRAALAAIDRALVLSADHELNPSSFTARVTASTGADPYACVSAALATLSGPRHGGASERVEALLEESLASSPTEVVRERLRRGEGIPGFGHPLYPDGDPRAVVLLEDARALAPRSREVRALGSLVDAMALAGNEHPTVDLGLVALAFALRLPPGSALALFAIGRSAGWLAHALEQRAQGVMLRPRARYLAEP